MPPLRPIPSLRPLAPCVGRGPLGRRGALLAACGRAERSVPPAADSTAVAIALPRPDFALTTTEGRPFDFRRETAGTVTFLMFGYTHCPDVCPVHLANMTAALGKLTTAERARTRVVFVTVDPDRDSPAVLRKFLDAFDHSYIGLTGSRAAIDSAQRRVNFAPAILSKDSSGAPVVTHSAPVVVITADDSAHVMFPFGARQTEWAREIPKLLARGAPAPALRVERAYLVIPVGEAPAALYFSASNRGSATDSIVAVEVPGAGVATMHEHQHDMATGNMRMVPVAAYPVGAGATLRLAPGGAHVMIEKPARAYTRGERFRLLVRFAHGGTIPAEVTVITYADLDSATAPSVTR
jgi:protein SCO1/2